MNPNLSDEENINLMTDVLGVDEPTARFILAIEKGEIDGDVIEVDEDGNEIRPTQPVP